MAGKPWQAHILSFEGPDAYARAGGIASRVEGLTSALAEAGYDTHLWFIGDPNLPAEERAGAVTLHRWGQWISRYHPGGVYDGEEGKRADYVAALPPYLLDHFIRPHLADPAHRVAILAEEWQTADAVLHLDGLLANAGLRNRVAMLWNANNTFGFDRVDWARLARACTITTVSRYMRHGMWRLGVDPVVIPNGLPADVYRRPSASVVGRFRHAAGRRPVLSKVARWDADKRWLLAVDITAEMKREGKQPLLVARGGMEAHGAEVLNRMRANGLRVVERSLGHGGEEGMIDAVRDTEEADVVLLTTPLDRAASQLLFAGSAAVLANSGREPFGLVGLEGMAAGGIVCVGGTGEDYAVPGRNALVLQTTDPREFIVQFDRLQRHPEEGRALRHQALASARWFAWARIVQRTVLPRLSAAVLSGFEDGAVADRAADPLVASPIVADSPPPRHAIRYRSPNTGQYSRIMNR